ncbi:MAG TPA: hypothetical protein VJ961_00660 [Mariprofundaceae bacterium]|nr:hypothetical protein [Mariprofundaceae bacterium]
MSEKIEQPIQFAGQGDKKTDAIMHWTRYTPKERKIQALKALFGMWALALLSIPIIIAHFVLVPGFFIAGIFFSYKKMTAGEQDAEHADGDCPSCGKAISINLERDGSLPQFRYCPECSEPIELTSLPEATTGSA